MDTQINFFSDPPAQPQDVTRLAQDPDAFGCCSRYAECSAACHCLAPGDEMSNHCLYRLSLESGKNFYGKNANGFSLSRYSQFCQRVDALSAGARPIFDWLLINFCEYNRATYRCVVRNESISELAAVGLFDFSPLGPLFLPGNEKMWSYSAVLSLVTANADFAPLFQQAQDQREAERKPYVALKNAAEKRGDKKEENRLTYFLKETLPGPKTKRFLQYWLDHDGIRLRDSLAEPYRLAQLPVSMVLYANELYRDTIHGYDSRIYPLSPYAVDGFLTLSSYEDEELRRIKLSRGYTEDEKRRRIADVEQARAERAEKRRNAENHGNAIDGGDAL